MGYGVVKIPSLMFKKVKIRQRYEYAVYKVAYHEDQILSILYDKKHSVQILLYILNNMNCASDLQPHHEQMVEMLDTALAKTNESHVKNKITT